MNIAWDRRTHNWDDEIILRTMMLGDIEDYREMGKHVTSEHLTEVFEKKSGELDRKSALFWGYRLGKTPKPSISLYERINSTTPRRHIAA